MSNLRIIIVKKVVLAVQYLHGKRNSKNQSKNNYKKRIFPFIFPIQPSSSFYVPTNDVLAGLVSRYWEKHKMIAQIHPLFMAMTGLKYDGE